MNRKACLDALAFEIECRRARGQSVPWQVRELVVLDIEEAAELADAQRLELIWRLIPVMVSEALSFMAEGRELPIRRRPPAAESPGMGSGAFRAAQRWHRGAVINVPTAESPQTVVAQGLSIGLPPGAVCWSSQ